MRYSLRTLARARGIRRKGVTFRPIEPTSALAALLSGPTRQLLAEIETELQTVLLPVYAPRPVITHDDIASTIGDALSAVGNTIKRLVVGIGFTPGAGQRRSRSGTGRSSPRT